MTPFITLHFERLGELEPISINPAFVRSVNKRWIFNGAKLTPPSFGTVKHTPEDYKESGSYIIYGDTEHCSTEVIESYETVMRILAVAA